MSGEEGAVCALCVPSHFQHRIVRFTGIAWLTARAGQRERDGERRLPSPGAAQLSARRDAVLLQCAWLGLRSSEPAEPALLPELNLFYCLC